MFAGRVSPSHTEPPHRRRSGPRVSVLLRALLGLAVVVGCEEVLVSPVPVATVEVVPDSAELFVGESVQLRAELRDDTGEEVAGRPITWRSGDTRMATVDTSGAVAAVGAGTTEVTATAEGQTGAASIVVLRRPRIELDRGSVAFSAIAGSGDPLPVDVGITNGGDGALEALALAVAYGDTVGGWLDAALDSTGTPTHMTLAARTAGLAPGPYAATVSVTDPAAENSPAELEVTFQVQQSIPVAPTALAADVSADTVLLTWTDNSDIETELRIERWGPADASFVLLATLGADATTYADTAVALDSRYRYRVRACNASGCSAFSDALDATTPPVAPADLAVASATIERVELTWTDASATETRFEVERRVGGGAFAALADVPADTGAFTDTTVVEDTEYAYRVRACNADGCSPYSAEATTPTPPTAPSDLVATAASDTAIDLTWSDNSATETGFRIERSTDDGTTFQTLVTVGADGVGYSDTGLDPATSYQYRVRACNGAGCSAPTAAASTSTSAIPAPSGLAATVVSDTRIDLAWTDNSDTEAEFRIQRSTDGGATFTALDTVAADLTAYSDTTATVDTEHTYRVAACDSAGCSAFSNRATATTRPGPPAGLTAAPASDTAIDLAWTDASATETEFRIERSTDGGSTFSALATVPGGSTNYRDTGLQPATSYTYRVAACNAAGCSDPSAPATAATSTIPAPSGLAATVVSIDRIDLAWTDNSATETGFRVERSTDGGATFDSLATVAVDGTAYSDTATVEDAAYVYRVAACDGSSCSPFSNTVSAATPPTAPTGLVVTSVAADRIELAWTDASVTETRFEVERSADGGAFTALPAAAADAESYTDASAAEDTEYAYRVRSCNAGGCSPYTGQVAVTTPPTAPSGLTATAASDTAIDLAWADNSDTETGFRIERSTDGGTTFTELITVGAGVTSYTDTGLDPSTSYAYRVRACNGSGCSAPTATATTSTSAIPAPSGLAATVVSVSRIDLDWTDNSATETGFRIERSTDGGTTFDSLATVGADVTTYSDGTTVEDAAYAYRVAACDGSGCSPFSNQVAATTRPTAPSGLSVTSVTADRIDLAWTDNAATETRFEVERSADGGAFTALPAAAADAESYTDAGTAEDTEYAYRVRACNGGGCSPYTAEVPVTTPPSAPSGLTAAPASDTAIDLAWIDNSATETGFRIERSTDGGATFTELATVAAGTTAYSDTGLMPATTYAYRVLACNASGCSAPTSSAAATTSAIPAPSSLTATVVSVGEIDLAWTDNAATETGFRIERSTDGGATFDTLATVGADVTSYADASTAEDTRYTYRVAACNASSCSPFSNQVTRTTPPSAASGLTASAASDTEIDLAWTDNSTYETEFRVQRSTDGGATFSALVTLAANSTSYTDDGLDPATTYAYRVLACNASGCADPTATASATTSAIPAPSALAATVVSAGRIDLTWTDNSTTESRFEVERSTDGGTTFAALATLGEDATAYTDDATVEDTEYLYRVAACNGDGCSAWSGTTAATTPPSAASGLGATVVSATQIDLAWTDNSTTETGFRVERAVGGGSFIELATVGADATTYTDNTTSADTEYAYRVVACNGSGCAAASNIASTPTPPTAPGGLSAAAASDTRIDLSWTDNSATESSFRVERRTGTDAFVQIATTGADVTSYSSTGLSPNTAYDFRIRACNAGGCSAYSATATVTTLATPPPADPSNLAATLFGTQDSTVLTWTDNATDEENYRVQRSVDGGTFTVRATLGANTTRFTDTDMAVDDRYTYRVEACSTAGCSGFSNEASVVTPPVAPSGLAAAVVSAGRIDLSWTDQSDTEDVFRIERSVDGGAFAVLDSVPTDSGAFSDLTTAEDTEYAYRVQACNGTGCSAFSAQAAATTPPTAASGLTATAVSDTEIDLAWTDNSDTETEFQIQRRISGGYSVIDTLTAGTTSYRDSGLTPVTTYEYRIVACNASGCADPSTAATATTQPIPVPSAPTGLTATAISVGQIDLAWTDNAANEDGFNIERSTDGGTTYDTIATVGADLQAYTDLTTVEDTRYTYRLAACNTSGCSPYSNAANDTTPPSAASAPTATATSDTGITVGWTDNSTYETEFRIERSPAGAATFGQVGTVGADIVTFNDTGLEPSTAYDYRVITCNTSGCAAPSGTATGTTQAIPAPSGLGATVVSAGQVDLGWTDNSATEDEFRVERSTDGGTTWAVLGTVGANVTSYSDATTGADSQYSYRVRACDASSCSAYSGTATATTPPSAPSGLTITSVSTSQIDLGWTDNSTFETRFEVQRSTDGGAFVALTAAAADATTYTDGGVAEDTEYAYRVRACNAGGCSAWTAQAATATPPSAASGLTATAASDTGITLGWADNSDTETGFRVERSPAGANTFAAVTTTAANATGYTDTGLEPATTYDYRVVAFNGAGDAAPTAVASATTAAIPAPSGLGATVVSAGRVDLQWTDNSTTEDEFRIERSEAGGAFAALDTVAAGVTTYSDLTTAEDTEYAYRVTACDANGCSPFSNEANVTTPPTAPSGLGITSVTAAQIDLAWTDNAGTETRFEVERSADGGAFVALANAAADATTYADGTVAEDTEYAYRVRACNAGGCSAWTAQASTTTPPSAASGLTATAASDTAIELTWTDNSATETGFRVERSPGGAGTFAAVTTTSANATAYTDTGLEPATTYDYRVVAFNGAGDAAPTAVASGTTSAIPAPTGLTATVVSASQLDLAWTDNATTETEFRIQRSVNGGAFAALDTVLADVTTYSDVSTAEDTRYAYLVQACDASSCSAFSNEASDTTPPTPATGLAATTASDTEIGLTWTDASATETEFRVERRTGAASFSQIASVGAGVTGYDDSGLQPATTYDYRVIACNTSGCADPSATASATTQQIPAPAAPSGLAATVISASRIDLAWTDNATTEASYRVERSTDGGATYDTLTVLAADAVAHSDQTTVEDTEYTYRVAACNVGGCSFSGTAADTTPPSAASGLAATVVSATQIDLAWSDNSTYETGFRIDRAVSGGSFLELATVGADVAAYTDNTTAADTEYAYRVVACNAGGCAAPSNIESTFTPPTTPDGLTATASSDTRIDLSWSDNSATESSFRVERRTGTDEFVQVATTGANVTSYSSTGLSPSTAYDFRIRACNVGGCSDYSSTVTATTLATPPPADPSNLTATLAGDQSSTALSWTDNATDEDEYRVERSVDGGTFTLRATLGANTTTFTDTDMSVDDRYTYRVEACSAAGCSGFSNEASVVTEPVPASGLTVTVVSTGRIDLGWVDESDTEAVFRIERSTDGVNFAVLDSVPTDSSAFSDLTTVEDTEYTYRIQACNTTDCAAYSAPASGTTPPSAASDLAATAASDTAIDLSWTDNSTYETGFRVQRRITGSFTDVDTVAADVSTFSDTGLAPATTYEHRVLACNDAGCAAPSDTATTTTDSIPAPTGLGATVVSAGQVDLAWTDNAATESEFRIQRSANGGTTWTSLATEPADAQSYSDLTTVEDTEYAYRVRACNASSCSTWSNEATATTPPAAASGLTATATSDTAIDLSWTDNSTYETEFRIERSTDGGNTFVDHDTVAADLTAYTDTGLAPNTAYAYQVLACSASGCAAPSPSASATTDPIPAPSGLTSTVISANRIDLAWTDNSATETRFQIERSTNGGTSFDSIDSTAADAIGYSDGTTVADTEYLYRVAACNADGCSDFSNTVTDTTPPAAASGVTVDAVSDSTVALSWTDASSIETGFRIERRTGTNAFAEVGTTAADVVTFTDGTVAPATSYDYRVLTCNGTECVVSADTASATTAPIPAPTGLAATVAADTTVDLSWTDNSTTETRFQIERSTDSGTSFDSIDSTLADATAYTDVSTGADTEYLYRIAACNADGCSARSGEVTVATTPAPASGVGVATVSSSELTVTWADNSTTETVFRIERRTGTDAFAEVGTAAANATSFDDSGLSPATTYDYRVLACNGADCAAPSAAASGTTADVAPSAPSDLTAATDTTGGTVVIDLGWTDTSDNEDEFRVERSSGGAFTPLDTVPAETVTYGDAAVDPDSTYDYRVQACNTAGCSAFTATATASTPPSAPTGLATLTVSDTGIDLSWTDNSSVETTFEIERRTGTNAFTQVTTVNTDVVTYSDTGLTASTTYDYRVRACNLTGCSPYTGIASATTNAAP